MHKGPRQGDVLLVPVTQVRGQRIKPEQKRYTVAPGEQTGHKHAIPATGNIEVFLSREGMFVSGTGVLEHEEHDPHQLDGDYEVVLQRRASDHRVVPSMD